MIWGIAGKACSGKNALAQILEKRGFEIVDLDLLGHSALEERKDQINNSFGLNLLLEDQSINRKKLGQIVFNNKRKLKSLEDIVHPIMFHMLKDKIDNFQGEKLLINGAILGKSGMDILCDKIIWVEASLFKRIERANKRDKLKLKNIFARIWSQMDLSIQHFSRGVDIYMVRNNGDLNELKGKIDSFMMNPDEYKRV